MATLSMVGIPGVGNPGTIYAPKLSNLWRITFKGLSGGAVNSNDVSLQAVSFSRPKVSHEEIAIHRYNATIYVPGKHSFEPANLVLEDDIGSKASYSLREQYEKQQRLIGADTPDTWLAKTITPSDFKFSMQCDMLDGSDGVLETWTLEGCWFTTLDFGELNYQGAEAVQINVTVRYDHAYQTITSGITGSAIGGFGS